MKKLQSKLESNLNLNVNQNDLVDMVISEKIDVLEEELISVLKEFKKYNVYDSPAQKAIDKKIARIKASIPLPSSYLRLIDEFKSLAGNGFVEEREFNFTTTDEYNTIPDIDEVGEKNTRSLNTRVTQYHELRGMTVTIHSKKDNDKFRMSVFLPSAFFANVIDEVLTLKNTEFVIMSRIKKLMGDIRKAKRSAPSAKAKLIRKALSGSEEGRMLLSIVDNAGIKLIS